MYGSSDPYRYGFTPEGNYVEFNGVMPTFCTSAPTVWQRDSTTITLATDTQLAAADKLAQSLIAKGDTAGAEQVLNQAITSSQGGK